MSAIGILRQLRAASLRWFAEIASTCVLASTKRRRVAADNLYRLALFLAYAQIVTALRSHHEVTHIERAQTNRLPRGTIW